MNNINPAKISLFDENIKKINTSAKILDEKVNEDGVTIKNVYEIEHRITKVDEYNYYKIKFRKSGRANFYIKTNKNNRPSIYLFDRDGLKLVDVSIGKTDKQLHHSVDVIEGEEYIIGITCNTIDNSCEYKFRAKVYDSVNEYNIMVKQLGLKNKIYSDYIFTQYGHRTLKKNRRGTDVVHLKRLLIKLGYTNDTIGVFNDKTQQEVKNFQRENHLKVDGLVGPNTRKTIGFKINEKRDVLSGRKTKFTVEIVNCYLLNKYKINLYDEKGEYIVSSDENSQVDIKLSKETDKTLKLQIIDSINSSTSNPNKWQYDGFCLDKIIENQNWSSTKKHAYPIIPRYINKADSRLGGVYDIIIDQFNVEMNERYLQNNNKSYCNIYVWDVTKAMSAEIPHWIYRSNDSIYKYNTQISYSENAKIAHELSANSVYKWMKKHHKEIGYKRVNALNAQQSANKGNPTITMWYSKFGGSGHMQIVRPLPYNESYNPSKGVYISQAGSKNYRAIYLRNEYSKKYQNELIYYTHNNEDV
ncbi:peptidoglycan-binding domain-containing protein [Clostridiaceae bacterium M8S5]|nr:peptidoglycan-binding domain-containing protein [Clostridiaceae bacterium M8S5]